MDALEMEKPIVKINFADMGNTEFYLEYFSRLIGDFAQVELSDNPDFLFCGRYGAESLRFNCVKIFYTTEEGEPDFNLYDYVIGYNEMQFYDRYLNFPLYARKNYKEVVAKSLEKHLKPDEYYLNKSKFCNFIYSNGLADVFRENTFKALNEYKHVDSAGRFLNNMGNVDIAGSRASDDWDVPKRKFMKDYRFTIAFSNTQKPAYADEKIFDAWCAGTIPIFWGDSTFSETFNSKSYIDCTKCEDVSQVVEKVREIEESPEKYLAMQKEPIVLPGSKFYEYYDESRLTEFLKQIMLQDPKKAKRISTGTWMKSYTRDMKLLAGVKKSFAYKIYEKASYTLRKRKIIK